MGSITENRQAGLYKDGREIKTKDGFVLGTKLKWDVDANLILYCVFKNLKGKGFTILPFSAKYCFYSAIHVDVEKDCFVDKDKAEAELFRRNKLSL